jgi:hypothetical protein
MSNHRARREAAAAIKEFANDHLIRTTDLPTEEKVAIETIRTAVHTLNKGYTLGPKRASQCRNRGRGNTAADAAKRGRRPLGCNATD